MHELTGTPLAKDMIALL